MYDSEQGVTNYVRPGGIGCIRLLYNDKYYRVRKNRSKLRFNQRDVTQVSKRVRISILFTLVGCQTLHFLLFPAYFFRLPQFSNVKDQIA